MEVMVTDFDSRAGAHSIILAVDRKLRKDSKYLSAGIQFNIQEIAGGLTNRAVCPLARHLQIVLTFSRETVSA
jgi:hypothetical protein